MRRAWRVILGLAILGLVLHAADLATRDCRLAPYVYEDCMWTWLRIHLHLPASKFLRMAAMECVGIVLALVLFFTCRYVFASRMRTPAPSDSASTLPGGEAAPPPARL